MAAYRNFPLVVCGGERVKATKYLRGLPFRTNPQKGLLFVNSFSQSEAVALMMTRFGSSRFTDSQLERNDMNNTVMWPKAVTMQHRRV